MKQLLIVYALLLTVTGFSQVRQLPAGGTLRSINNTTAVTPASLAGAWSGTQTAPDGLYPQNISVELTGNGDWLIPVNGQPGIYAGRGTYSVSGNSISGSYKMSSSGETFSFVATYDAGSQQLAGTVGAGNSVTNQGKWTMKRISPAAQLVTPVRSTIGIKPAPAPATSTPPPASTTPAASSGGINYNYDYNYNCPLTNPNEYYLSDVLVTFYTGADNKEALSTVDVNLFLPPGVSRYTYNKQNPGVSLIYLVGTGERPLLKSEFRSNTATTIQLESPFSPCLPAKTEYRPDEISLSVAQSAGLQLYIDYSPNFFLDAWKIEKIEVRVRFRKTDGTAHPLYGNKLITFGKAVLLKEGNRRLICEIDKFLANK